MRVDAHCTIRILLCLVVLVGSAGPVVGVGAAGVTHSADDGHLAASEPSPNNTRSDGHSSAPAPAPAPPTSRQTGTGPSVSGPDTQVTYSAPTTGVIEVTQTYSGIGEESVLTLSVPTNATVTEVDGFTPRSDLPQERQDTYPHPSYGHANITALPNETLDRFYLYNASSATTDSPTLTYQLPTSAFERAAVGDGWTYYPRVDMPYQSTAITTDGWMTLNPEYTVSDPNAGYASQSGRVLLGDVTTSRHTTGAETITFVTPDAVDDEVAAAAWADIDQARERFPAVFTDVTTADTLSVFYLPLSNATVRWSHWDAEANPAFYAHTTWSDGESTLDYFIELENTSAAAYTYSSAHYTRKAIIRNRFDALFGTQDRAAINHYMDDTASGQYSADCVSRGWSGSEATTISRQELALANLDYRLQTQHNTSLDVALARTASDTAGHPSGQSAAFLSVVETLSSADTAESFRAAWVGNTTPAPWNETKHRVVFGGQPNGSTLETTGIEAVIEEPDGTQSRQTLTPSESSNTPLTVPAGSRITLTYTLSPEQSACTQTYHLSASENATIEPLHVTLTPGEPQPVQGTLTVRETGMHSLQPLSSQPAITVNVTSAPARAGDGSQRSTGATPPDRDDSRTVDRFSPLALAILVLSAFLTITVYRTRWSQSSGDDAAQRDMTPTDPRVIAAEDVTLFTTESGPQAGAADADETAGDAESGAADETANSAAGDETDTGRQ